MNVDNNKGNIPELLWNGTISVRIDYEGNSLAYLVCDLFTQVVI